MTKELFPDEIERGAREALGELGFADDQRFVAVQQFRIAEGIELDLQLPELALALDQVARGMNATVVFFAAGTCPGHDSYETYDRIKSLMKEDAIVYYNGAHVWKVVGLVSRASAVVSTSLHVRIMSFIHSKPRVTWCTGPKHKKFLELWDTKESAPLFCGEQEPNVGASAEPLLVESRPGQGDDGLEVQQNGQPVSRELRKVFDAAPAPDGGRGAARKILTHDVGLK
eukprot:CAMPEP_0201258378 /NCGR_PEP_ID=MMETSP0853-20130426/2641_1 /ASSEMBLY_ACC=CAM_ASM_000640 /TAXON_ID=183588 /ORGANISM="Pseudo-nitzschia fraudulenta, Strain WWA7" /LENGTH=227 /DNA_ID=CAMNT_0047559853 /DNA_START=15 /DNA_END=697 /DNA_ORIENTATION=-